MAGDETPPTTDGNGGFTADWALHEGVADAEEASAPVADDDDEQTLDLRDAPPPPPKAPGRHQYVMPWSVGED